MLIHGAVDNDIHPPRFGGTQRAFGLYRGLARHHRVRVLCVVPNRTRAPREETVDGVTLVRRKRWATSLAWRLERAGLAPLFTAAWAHRAGARGLVAALPGPADALLADFHLTGLFAASRAPLAVYLSQNVEADLFRSVAPRLAGRPLWAERVRAFEAAAVTRASLTVVVSAEDAERMRALYDVPAERLLVIPNGYDETAVRPPTDDERSRARAELGLAPDSYVAAFVGSDFEPNREALRWIVTGLAPALAPGVRLVIAGAVSRALGAAPPGVVVAGEVPDLLSVLHAADAGLNPVAGGAGSNVKLPTYLAAGLAVVTTPFGLRGFPGLGPHVLAAPREGFAELLNGRPAGWRAMGLALPRAVADHAWGRLGERLGDRLAGLLAGGSPAGEEERRGRARA